MQILSPALRYRIQTGDNQGAKRDQVITPQRLRKETAGLTFYGEVNQETQDGRYQTICIIIKWNATKKLLIEYQGKTLNLFYCGKSEAHINTAANQKWTEFVKRPDNQACADCGDTPTRFCAMQFGCFVCEACSGRHRAFKVDNGYNIIDVNGLSTQTLNACRIPHVYAPLELAEKLPRDTEEACFLSDYFTKRNPEEPLTRAEEIMLMGGNTAVNKRFGSSLYKSFSEVQEQFPDLDVRDQKGIYIESKYFETREGRRIAKEPKPLGRRRLVSRLARAQGIQFPEGH